MRTLEVITPAGIGDASWVHCKLRGLQKYDDVKIVYYGADENPQRLKEFIELLPGCKWGGYLKLSPNWAISQCVPDYPPYWGTDILYGSKRRLAISMNAHLECGRRIEEFLPFIPTDLHYPLQTTDRDATMAEKISEDYPYLAVYVSSRRQEAAWRFYTSRQWADLFIEASRITGLKRFVVVGAGYDVDQSMALARELTDAGLCVDYCLGQPLGVALRVIKRSAYFFSFPSGLGIMANVMRTPCLMFLPKYLKGLEKSYADPQDMETGQYRAWVAPPIEEAVEWFRDVGSKHANLP